MVFDGYKTYIFSALLLIFAVLYAFGLITNQTFITLVGIFGAGGFFGLRRAIKANQWKDTRQKQTNKQIGNTKATLN